MTQDGPESPSPLWQVVGTAIGWSVVFGIIALAVAGVLGLVAAIAATGSASGAAEWLVVLGPVQMVVQGTASLCGAFAATYLVGVRRFRMAAGDLRSAGFGHPGPTPGLQIFQSQGI